MDQDTSKTVYVAGVIERHDNHILIVLPAGSTGISRQWQFPRGRAKGKETPEAATRRMAEEDLGIEVEIVVGQPPLLVEIDGQKVELRYFFCGIMGGDLVAGPYTEFRWVHKEHLREYELDAASLPVAQWLLEKGR